MTGKTISEVTYDTKMVLDTTSYCNTKLENNAFQTVIFCKNVFTFPSQLGCFSFSSQLETKNNTFGKNRNFICFKTIIRTINNES